MKLVVVASGGDYKDGGNAASIHTREVANNLSKFFEVYLFYVSSVAIHDTHIIKKIKILPYLQNRVLRFVYYYFLLPFYFSYKFFLVKNSFIYCRFGALSFAAMIGAKVSGRKYISEVNGLKADEMTLVNTDSFLNQIKLPLLSLLELLIFKCSHGIVAVTAGIKDSIVKMYNINPELVRVIPNGVNIDIYRPVHGAKEKLGLQKDLHYICFVGNLAPWQGVEYILRVVPRVVKHDPNARFLIVGDGVEMRKLKTLAQELRIEKHVIFTGRVPYTKTSEYISASEFCLAPWIPERNSKIGLSPLKLYSYLACGKPVIASRIPGVYEEIEKFDLGSIADPKNENEFSKTIIKYLQGGAKKEKNSNSLRRFVFDNYTWGKSALKIRNFISGSLKSKEK